MIILNMINHIKTSKWNFPPQILELDLKVPVKLCKQNCIKKARLTGSSLWSFSGAVFA